MAVSAGMALISTLGVAVGVSAPIFGLSLMGHFLVTTAIGAAINALTPKPEFAAAAATGYNVTTTSSIADHQIIYGETKVAGVRVFDHTTGTDNKYLHRVLAFSGHEIESFSQIIFNDEVITLDGSGNVTSPSRYNGFVRVNIHTGADDQLADSDLVSEVGQWTTNHRLRGIAYLYIRFKFDQDVFPNGLPEVFAVIKGKKVYDPRSGLTAWSDNPALCIRDYITNTRYGLGESVDNVDENAFITAANVCDYYNYPIQTGDKRYTCNGSFLTGANPYDFLNNALSSMGGLLWYAQGKWRIKPAYWTEPVALFTEDDLRSSISVATRHSRRDNFNTVNGTWKGAETNWQATDFPPVTNQDFIDADNGQEKNTDLSLPFTTDLGMARRIANIYLERNRQQLTVMASFGMRAFQVQVGDNVRISNARFGWVQKEFEVVSWTFGLVDNNDLQVHMTLREITQSVFDDIADGAVYERDNTTLQSPFDVPIPSLDAASAITSVNEDGTTIPEIGFSWSVTDPTIVDYYNFEWKLSGASTWNSLSLEGTEFLLSPAISGAAYDYRVQAVNHLGVRSAYASAPSPVSTGNDATTPNAPSGLSAAGGYGSATVTWTAPTQNTDSSALKDLFQYKVYRGTSANPTTLVGRVSGEIFTDSGLLDNTTYYYRVKAIDFTGNESDYSADASVTTNPQLTDGVNGVDGNSVALLSIYLRASSLPATPTGGSFNFGTVTLTPPTGWNTTPPAGTDPIYISNATASIQGTTGTDSSLTWSTPKILAQNGADGLAGVDGADGADGTSVTILGTLASTGDLPTSGNTTGDAYLIDGDLYVWDGSAWNNVGAIQGPAGSDGKSVYTAIVFVRAASAPSAPTGGSFDFGTNILTPPTGWYLDIPSGTDPIYGTRYVFSIIGDTGSETAGTWSTPFLIAENGTDGADGLDGADGADGLSTYLASVFLRSATAPSTPTGGSYDFGTNTLTAPTSWSTSVPSGTNPLYVSTALASIQGVTGIDSTLSWTSPVILAQDGVDGTNGTDGADGADGARGPGRWNIGVTTLPTTSSGAHTDFTNALFDPVDNDQAWFYTGTLANPTAQTVWIYREGSGATPADSWVEQVEVIDGDLLVAGTITGDKVAASSVITSSAQIDDAIITNAKIADATIDNAKISNLSADKINAGTLSVDYLPGLTSINQTITTSNVNLVPALPQYLITTTLSGIRAGTKVIGILTLNAYSTTFNGPSNPTTVTMEIIPQNITGLTAHTFTKNNHPTLGTSSSFMPMQIFIGTGTATGTSCQVQFRLGTAFAGETATMLAGASLTLLGYEV